LTAAALRPTLIGQFETGSPEWHLARVGALGGSEIAAAMGLSPFESPFSLWHRKQGMVGPVEDNGEMYWGRMQEPALRKEFRKRHPEFVVAGDVGTWRHGEHPHMVANPDALLFNRGGHVDPGRPDEIWEGKVCRDRDKFGEEGSDDVPVYYRAQGLHYADVFAVKRIRMSVLFCGSEYVEFVIEYDEADAAILRRCGAEFVASLIEGRRPPIDSHQKTYDTIRQLHPGIEDYEVELERDVALPYLEAVAAYDAAKTAKRAATSVVMDVVGDGRKATWIGEPIARRQRVGDAVPFLVYIPAKPDKKVIA
jgi:putative phage-type endonuclease